MDRALLVQEAVANSPSTLPPPDESEYLWSLEGSLRIYHLNQGIECLCRSRRTDKLLTSPGTV